MLTIFTAVFFAVFMAEMGDKTQLLLVAMTGKYKIRDILIGTWAATIVLNFIAVAAGAALSSWIDMRIIKSIAALAFFYFSWSTVKDLCFGDDEEEELKNSKTVFAIAAIFISFFVGELGDKTQLSAITLSASFTDHNLMNAFFVFLGATLALIAADFLGLLAGLYLKNKLPVRALNIVSASIFALFGFYNSFQAGKEIFNQTSKAGLVCAAACLIIYLFSVVITIMTAAKSQRLESTE